MSAKSGYGEEQLSRGAWAGRVLGAALTGAAVISQVQSSKSGVVRCTYTTSGALFVSMSRGTALTSNG